MRKEKLIFGHVTFKWGDTLADIESQISEQDIISRSDDSLYTNKALTIKLTDIWSIGDLLITDDHSRPETQAFITHIERILKTKITCHQDCSG